MLDELEEHGLPHTSLLLLSLRPLVVPEAGENGKRKREEGRGARGGGIIEVELLSFRNKGRRA